MRNIKLSLAYDGTDLHGWQIQPNVPTVQGLLTSALEQITQEPVKVHGAGRTDAGVHAWGQVANFQTDSALPPETFLRALNALLPPSIRVRAASEVAEDFHARWHAMAKTYEYRVHCGCAMPPFWRSYVLHHPYPLDFAAMAQAARYFEGQHDFALFAASTGSDEEDRERTTIRTIYRSECVTLWPPRERELYAPSSSHSETKDRDERYETSIPGSERGNADALASDQWVYIVRGQSFLRHMVRKMVGTLLSVGCGRIAPAEVPHLLERGLQRAPSLRVPGCEPPAPECPGATAPAHGLCLVSVEYPDATTGTT